MRILLTLLMLLPIVNTNAQRKLYFGFSYNMDMVTNVKVNKSYLSEFPMFIKPLKLEKKNQWNSRVIEKSSYMPGVVGGVQMKKFFIDASFTPYIKHGFSIKGLKLSADSKTEESYEYIKYNFITTDFGINFKYLLTGRKRMRLLGIMGLSTMYIHDYKTYYGDKKKYNNLNKYYLFSDDFKTFYNKASIGLEWMFEGDAYNGIIGINYVKQLTSVDESIRINYLSLSIKYFKYFEKYKKTIYIHE